MSTHHHHHPLDPRAEQADESLAVTSPEGKRVLLAVHRVEGTVLRIGQQVTRIASDVASLKTSRVSNASPSPARSSMFPPGVNVEDVTDASPSGLHQVVNPIKWEAAQEKARRWDRLVKAGGIVTLAVVTSFAVVGAWLAAASLYDAARRHPSLTEHASHE